MDRFAWLDAQKWWISPWQGCSQCSACSEQRLLFCSKIKWLFRGFASFHVNAREGSNAHQDIPCSPEAAHLFFAAHSTLSDPAQLALRLGILMEKPREMQGFSVYDISGREKLMLAFDSSNPFFLEIPQVQNFSLWTPDVSCSACQTQKATRKEDSEQIHCGICRPLPNHVTLNLRHVSLNIYADEELDERFPSTISLAQVMEILDKIFLEPRQVCSSDNNSRDAKRNEGKLVELPTNAREVLSNTNMLLQKYLNDIDCVSECAIKAVEVCSADPPWMGRMLDVMAQHAGHHSLELDQLETLKELFHQRLEECMEKEKLLIKKTWRVNSRQLIQQQKMQDSATSTLELLKQERDCIEKASLWVELLCTGLKS